MRLGVVTEGDADDLGAGILHGPDGREDVRESFLRGLTRDGTKDFGALRAGHLDVIAFVVDHEGGRDALHDRVFGLGDGEGEVAVAMPTGATTDELVVILGGQGPVIPRGGMEQDDALPRRAEVSDGLLELRRAELTMVAAEDEQVGLRKQREGLLEVRGRGDVITGGLGRQGVGSEEERREVMGTAGAGEEHPELTRLARTKLLAKSLGGLGIILRQKVAGAFVGLLLAGLRQSVLFAAGRVGRAPDFDGDRHGGRRNRRVFGPQDKLVDDLVAFDREPERTHLAAVPRQELAGRLRTRDIAEAVVIGEITASIEDLLLNLAAQEVHFGDHGDAIVRAPATDGAEEVDTISHGTDRNLHLLGEALGIHAFAGAALEYDHVQSVLSGLRVDDPIRDSVGLNLTELRERQGVSLGFLAGIEAGGGGSGEGIAQVQQAETSDGLTLGRDRHAAEVGDHVAEAFGAKRFEAFGHERIRAALAADDIGHLEFGRLSGRKLELHEGGVLAADQGRILGAVLHLEVPGTVLVVDHAVGVDDMDQHLGRRVRADALQVRPELVADIADLVTGLADGDEELLALGGVTGLLDLRAKLRYQVVLGRAAAGVQLGEHGSRTLGDRGIRVTDQLGDLHGAKLHRGERLGFQGVQDESGPLRTTDERGVQGGAERAGRLRERAVEQFAHGDIAAGSQGAGGGDGDGFTRGGQGLREHRSDLGVGVAQQHEDADGGDLRLYGRLLVGDDGEETTSDGGEFHLEAAVGDP